MKKIMEVNTFILLIILLTFIQHHPWPTAGARALSTESRWIIDGEGRRVKLACVNWVAHLEPTVAEGLSKQPVEVISKKIIKMGFNCVRLTWPLFLATNETIANQSVRNSFTKLGLLESIHGLQLNNPSFLDVSLIHAFQMVVESLAKKKVMVILDNHLSKPGWCCSYWDGNGFFGDEYFDPNLWIIGLTKMASLFKDNPYVIGMSLRNELRGPKQDIADWYRYMQEGAEAVHEANPNVLVILSGLNYDRYLNFLLSIPLNLTFTGKLVFEVHWYGFSNGQDWIDSNPNEVCGKVVDMLMHNSGFLLDQGFPLFVSEFGLDFRGTNENDNRYFNCFLAWAAEYDVDWALWTLVGSYYIREEVVGMNEYYGVLDWNWVDVRNASFLHRISVVQQPFQGPVLSDSKPHKIIFHPSTGQCIFKDSHSNTLQLGNCKDSIQWNYTNHKILTMKSQDSCLQAQGIDLPTKMSVNCSIKGTIWDPISDSKLHLATTLASNITVCLDVGEGNSIISTTCKCLQGDNRCDPGSQWFNLIDVNNDIFSSTLIKNMDTNVAIATM